MLTILKAGLVDRARLVRPEHRTLPARLVLEHQDGPALNDGELGAGPAAGVLEDERLCTQSIADVKGDDDRRRPDRCGLNLRLPRKEHLVDALDECFEDLSLLFTRSR